MNIRSLATLALVLVFATTTLAAQSGRARRVTPKPAPETAPAEQAPADTAAEPAPPERKPPVAVNATVPARYAGGSLSLENGTKLKVVIKDLDIRFTAKNIDFSIASNEILDISYGQSVRNRTAEGVGVSVIAPGAGDIIGRSRKVDHYIEILWNGQPDGGIVLRVDKDDYRGLIAALEASTGLRVRRDPAPPYRDFP